MKKIEKIIGMVEEIIIGEDMVDEERHKELLQQNKKIFEYLIEEIETVNDVEKKKKLKGLLMSYSESEAKYQSYTTRFAYGEGAKIGYSFGKIEDCFSSFR